MNAYTELGDDELLESYFSGDEHAVNVLVQRYKRLVDVVVGRIIKDNQGVEDVSQIVFMYMARGLSGFRRDASFKPWLMRIATNTAINYNITKGRKSRLIYTLDDPDKPELPQRYSIQPSQEKQLMEEDRSIAIENAFDRFNGKNKDLLLMKYMWDMTEEEIAKETGFSKNKISSKVHKTKIRFRKRYPKLVDLLH